MGWLRCLLACCKDHFLRVRFTAVNHSENFLLLFSFFFFLISFNSLFKTMFLFLENERATWIPSVGEFGCFLESIWASTDIGSSGDCQGWEKRSRRQWEVQQWTRILQVLAKLKTLLEASGMTEARSVLTTEHCAICSSWELPGWPK